MSLSSSLSCFFDPLSLLSLYSADLLALDNIIFNFEALPVGREPNHSHDLTHTNVALIILVTDSCLTLISPNSHWQQQPCVV